MAEKVLLAGTANAVRAAMRRLDSTVIGAALLGGGEADTPVLARAAAWDAFDFKGIDADVILLAEPPVDGAEARAVLERAADARMVVSLIDKGAARRLRLDDLVGRPPTASDDGRGRALVTGKRILITGGGGSIGAELARRVMRATPSRLTVLDSSEYNLFKIAGELPNAIPVLADIRDPNAVKRWFERERPEIVFHAAALKQVPLVEAFASEGVMTNLVGLRHVAEATHAVGAELVFVSTDKAVEPSGVMGATKRLGELYCQALDRRGPRRAIPVRLGNVLGSTGSVAPTFADQLSAGGPLTVTHPEVTRFFLTIPQAAESLLQAAAIGLDSEVRGAAFTIDMGEALPVVELAREVIRLEGLRPEIDVPIAFTGLRPGEKLHEALIGADETRAPDPAPGVMLALSPARDLAELDVLIDELALRARDGAKAAIRERLFAAIGASARTAKERLGAS